MESNTQDSCIRDGKHWRNFQVCDQSFSETIAILIADIHGTRVILCTA